MKLVLLHLLFACFLCGCDTVRYFSADRGDKEKREALEKERVAALLRNYELRYLSGEIDRDAYNRVRRAHGLSAID
ncbi:MAG: hypothetical protein CMO66_03280 [Verrucomicrobiales bacterium]|nr:hypothetical protein [Verrucomicrobiales bacterium]|tara:strand:- start:430 stop:657 length:228 start_codon:yes stop_codon:yes gene_type:complete